MNKPIDVAEVIRARMERAAARALPRGNDAAGRPLSRAQQEIWFMDRLARPASAYTVSLALKLRRPLDLDRLRRAVGAVVARHEELRVTVEERDGVPEAVVHPSLAIPVQTGGVPEMPLDGPLLRIHLLPADAGGQLLLLFAHHLVSDAASMEVIAADLARAYRGEDLGSPPYRYRDIADWQEQRSARRLGRDVAYWREQLRGAPEVLDLPGTTRPQRRTYRGRALSITLPGAERTETLLAAWAAVLRRHSGQDDLVIGTAISGRDRPEAEQVVGPLVNLVPLRLTVDPIASGPELVEAAREALLGALNHAALPFGALVEALRPTRTSRYHPVFQATFDVIDGMPNGLDFGSRSAEPVLLSTAPARVDLALSVDRRGSARLVAADDMVTEEHARRLLDEFASTVAALAGPPAITLRAKTLPEPDTIPRMIDRWTARTPDAVAVEDGTRSLSYAELDRRSKALAGRLTGTDLVGVLVDRGVDLVVALLAVMRAGAAYLPLDPGYPPARTGLLLAESGTEVVLTSPGTCPPPGARTRVEMGDEGEPADASVSPGDLAYVIYTSGSTGKPKGVEVTHYSLAAFVHAMGDLIEFGPGDAILALTTIAFDIAAAELFLPLARGGRVVIAPDGAAGDPGMIRRMCGAHGVTVLQATPVTWRALGSAPVPGLRVALCGGEALPADLARQITGVAGQAWNLYGPTETTIWSTAQPLDASMTGRIPIGTPLPGTTAEVVDRWLRPVLPGDPGELCIGGAGVARGYRNRPDLTAERFVPGPSGQRVYRTGDRGRLRPDGVLEFLGRLDDQLKVHGLRVEPGEVEAAARALPGVADAAVSAPRGILTCYVTAGPGGVGPEAGLRSALAEVLPGYLVPARIVALDELPLTPNGKLDRRALPAPGPPEPAGRPGRPPRTPREEILCGLFADLLGLPKVDIDDDFFALGGHSLLVMRLLARVRTVLGLDVQIRSFFDNPTVARLAAALEPSAGGRPRLGAAERPETVPLSPVQEGLWFLYRLEGPSPTYNVPLAWRLRGSLAVGALEAAVRDVVTRHEALRTVLPERNDGGPVQQVADPGSVPFRVTAVAAEELPGRLGEAAGYEFALDREPPLRAEVFAVAPDEHVLLLLAHHVAWDEWSEGPLRRDLATAYAARLSGHAPCWRPLPVQYADYAVWQRALLAEQRQLDYWKDTLAGLPEELALPADRPRPAESSGRGGTVPFELGPDLRDKLRRLAGRSGVTMFMVLRAAVAVLLTRLGAGTDLPLGVPVAGRADPMLDDLVGLFVNTLVLRADTAGNPSFAELLGRIKEADLTAFEHAEVPFERVVEAVNPPRSLGRHPLFQVMVSHQGGGAEAWDLAGVRATAEPVRHGTAKFDLSFDFTEAADSGSLEYSADLFDRATAAELAERLLRVLRAVAEAPGLPISRVQVLSEREHAFLASVGTGAARPVPETTVPGLFSAQAARTPEATALCTAERSWTFAELESWTDRVAWTLIGRGVHPGHRVALDLPRSLMVPAILAVHKCGAAYLPLDPEQPEERARLMLDDAKPAMVVRAADLCERAGGGPVDRSAHASAAYVIYTSGSTGRPKGVVVPHRALVSLFLTHRSALMEPAGRGLRVAHAASFAFDGSWEPLIWMLDGHALHVIDGYWHDSVLVSYLARHGIDVLDLTPTYLSRLAERDPGWVRRLRVLLVGGEPVSRELWRWACGIPGLACHDLYGPTEAGVDAYGWQGLGRVPYLLDNVRVRVVDRWWLPVPPGVVGELCVAGDGLADGYLNQPELTAERFVPDPLGPPGARMYRTGDLARWTRTGMLELAGRADDQVKIRGFRVEPGEVETVLAADPAVRQAVVVAREDVPGLRRLVGYVVGRGADPAALRARVAAALPEYMTPAAIVIVDELPRTPNGKLDQARLPAPDVAALAGDGVPRDDREKLLCELFAETLGLPRVGAGDDFFLLGGNSIVSVQLASRARAAGLALTTREVYRHRTPAALASWLKGVL